MIKDYLNNLYKLLVVPKSVGKDQIRREFILNILLSGCILLTAVAFILNVVYLLFSPVYRGLNPFVTFFTLGIFCFLLFLSRIKKHNIAAFIFIVLLFSLGLYAGYQFGVDLPESLLIYSLVIVIAGILFSAKFAFRVTVFIGIVLIGFSFLQLKNVYQPNSAWKTQTIHLGDIIVYVITLELIAVVSWLANREIENSLRRARISEKALLKEKDLLEERVEQRTKELKQMQAERMVQMYRFSEFGRIASGLFHDLVNPLNLVMLNLDELSNASKNISKINLRDTSQLLATALKGTKRLEEFIQAARQQMQHQQIVKRFSPRSEIQQALLLLAHKIKAIRVTIVFETSERFTVIGNPVKFRQVVTNLLSNAIGSYDGITNPKKLQVIIRLRKTAKTMLLEIQDFGSGIEKKNLSKVFDPWFTTKDISKGTGIGLFLTKDIIMKDFHGKISVLSNIHEGTTFKVTIPLQDAKK